MEDDFRCLFSDIFIMLFYFIIEIRSLTSLELAMQERLAVSKPQASICPRLSSTGIAITVTALGLLSVSGDQAEMHWTELTPHYFLFFALKVQSWSVLEDPPPISSPFNSLLALPLIASTYVVSPLPKEANSSNNRVSIIPLA